MHIDYRLTSWCRAKMSDMQWFSYIERKYFHNCPFSIFYSWCNIFNITKYLLPHPIREEEVHISASCIGTREYLGIFREFGRNFTRDDIRSFSCTFYDREDIDTVFSEFRLRGRGNLWGKWDLIQTLYGLWDEWIDMLHRGEYSENEIKIEYLFDFILPYSFMGQGLCLSFLEFIICYSPSSFFEDWSELIIGNCDESHAFWDIFFSIVYQGSSNSFVIISCHKWSEFNYLRVVMERA